MISPLYPVCGNDLELTLHILVSYSFAKELCLALGVGWFFGNSNTANDLLN